MLDQCVCRATRQYLVSPVEPPSSGWCGFWRVYPPPPPIHISDFSLRFDLSILDAFLSGTTGVRRSLPHSHYWPSLKGGSWNPIPTLGLSGMRVSVIQLDILEALQIVFEVHDMAVLLKPTSVSVHVADVAWQCLSTLWRLQKYLRCIMFVVSKFKDLAGQARSNVQKF
jgi:hypothetical protein